MKNLSKKFKRPNLRSLIMTVLTFAVTVPLYIASGLTARAEESGTWIYQPSMYYAYTGANDVFNEFSSGSMKYALISGSLVARTYVIDSNSNFSFGLYLFSDKPFKVYSQYSTDGQTAAYNSERGIYYLSYYSGAFSYKNETDVVFDGFPNIEYVDNISNALIADLAVIDVSQNDYIETPDSIDTLDSDFYFIGFKGDNYVNASWQDVSDRTYMLDIDPEYYISVGFGYADSGSTEVTQKIWLEDDFDYNPMKLSYDITEHKNKYDDMYLRAVYVVPSYRSPGAGWWHGQPSTIYLKEDGSLESVSTNYPNNQYGYKHNFSTDKYITNIPTPELSNLSHNGFTLLNNYNNEYFVDIIVESNLYGVKLEKTAGSWMPITDTDWIYNSHYYNFADTSQVAINDSDIYIPFLYGVNLEDELIRDFKNWSLDYSSYHSLPTYSFLRGGSACRTAYNMTHIYSENSTNTDSQQLAYSEQGETVYYVRYYNKSMQYGAWARYKFRDGAQVVGGFISVGQIKTDELGQVVTDENGNPIVSDEISGRQDYTTGETSYSDSSFSISMDSVDDFFEYIRSVFESIKSSLTSFGSLLSACFPFLPPQLTAVIIFGIVLMVFVGVIKAVI